MIQPIERIEINREMKLHLLKLLKKGYITQDDVRELGVLSGIEPITIEIIDSRLQVENMSREEIEAEIARIQERRRIDV